MLALEQYESEVHDTCGLHDSIARMDPHLRPEHDYCPSCAAVTAYERIEDGADERATGRLRKQYGDEIPPEVPRPDDGRNTTFRIVSPASEVPPVTEGDDD